MESRRSELCVNVEVDPLSHLFEYPEVVEYFKQGKLTIAPQKAKLQIGAVSLVSYGDDSADALRRLVYMCKAISVEYSLLRRFFFTGGDKE
ncbi:MAG: hypothetical protein DRO99_01305 [Candidatus Aenigmatarchaeota archaeon]|nr:MAG: hypothetical protein DRO99_01305 [Candidatus Aenigmarchaeota archaeon]